MKNFVYVALFIILGSFVYNLISFEYGKSIIGEENFPYLLGLAAGLCGLIICFILLKYYRLKENLNQKSN
jgi:hypothetical protein